MEYWIENEHLKVGSIEKGAELSSIVYKKTGREFLWQAGDLWKRKSPSLFPVVGNCKDGQLIVDGKAYPMTSHGFARDLDFEMIKKDVTSVTYRLTENEYTLKMYPFQFEFYVTYTLIGHSLDVNFEVVNRSERDLYFSAGGHTAFLCNEREGENFTDFYLEFEQPENAGRYFKRKLLSDQPEEYLKDTKILKLTPELFAQDALIFKDLVSDCVTLKNVNDGAEVKVTFKGFPVLIIWSKGDGFVCIEPCEGCDDAESFAGDITQKEKMVRLAPGETYDKSFQYRIHG